MPVAQRLCAEFAGSFWLVRGGCGSAVITATLPQLGIGSAGALSRGLAVTGPLHCWLDVDHRRVAGANATSGIAAV
jgi:aquaporin Z